LPIEKLKYLLLEAQIWTNPHADKEGIKSVGQKEPNAWDLHDMLRNAWEWGSDLKGIYPSGLATDPKGPQSGDFRVARGGNWGGHGFRVIKDI